MALVHVTDDDFDDRVLDSEIPVLVDFWAAWCAPCRALAPTLERIADDLDGELLVVKYDTEHNGRVSDAMSIRSLPTLVLFKDGRIDDVQVGALPHARLEAWIQRRLAPRKSLWNRLLGK
jgi:thioredoxin 1